jgi:GTP cyclohydrolase II
MIQPVSERLISALRLWPAERPFVTLTFAQSLDGSIAARPRQRLRLSGSESLRLTHWLRSAHDSILVGIGTVLADDPRLTVRLVEGNQPQPVVLDTHLRTAPSARLLTGGGRSPWIVCAFDADVRRRKALETCGACVIEVTTGADGYLQISEVLAALANRGIRSVMVEGGAAVIQSFLTARLVDYVILTIAPVLVGGVGYLQAAEAVECRDLPRLHDVLAYQLGDDMIVEGVPQWPSV